MIESLVVEEKLPTEKPVDREKTCPLLLRVFCNIGRHFDLSEYQRGNVPSTELQMYTWMDATLRELATLVRDVNPDYRRKGTYFDFGIVYPDTRGSMYRMREIGSTCSGQRGLEDSKTLSQAKFTIGDYLSICVTPPNRERPSSNSFLNRDRPQRRMRPY